MSDRADMHEPNHRDRGRRPGLRPTATTSNGALSPNHRDRGRRPGLRVSLGALALGLGGLWGLACGPQGPRVGPDASRQEACAAYCEHLAECDFIDSVNVGDCTESCASFFSGFDGGVCAEEGRLATVCRANVRTCEELGNVGNDGLENPPCKEEDLAYGGECAGGGSGG